MQQTLNEISKIGIQFGPDYDTDGKAYIKVQAKFNSQQANEIIESLKQQTNNLLEIPWSFILVLTVNQQNKQNLINLLDNLITKPVENNSQIHSLIQDQIKAGQLKMKYFDKQDKIFIQIQLNMDPIKEPFQVLFENGLKDFFKDYSNQVQLSVSTNNTIDDIKNELDKGERLGSILLNSCKLDLQLSLGKDIGNKLKEIFATIDPDFANSPPFIFLKYFKSLDVDMRFNSTNELPEPIKKKVLFGKRLQELLPEEKKMKDNIDQTLNVLLDFLDTDIDIYFSVPDAFILQINGHAPSLSTFLKSFGGYFFK